MEWLDQLMLNPVESDSWAGNDFANACGTSLSFKKPIWEHRLHKGLFTVASQPPLKLDNDMNNWICYGIPQELAGFSNVEPA
jgi:hypothetical protein